jgi:hypothetical protein
VPIQAMTARVSPCVLSLQHYLGYFFSTFQAHARCLAVAAVAAQRRTDGLRRFLQRIGRRIESSPEITCA